MSRRPVLVIHGVANTDEAEFGARVAALGEAIRRDHGDRWELVPVFWDRLGADIRGVEAAIPPLELGGHVRGGLEAGVAAAGLVGPGLDLLNAGGPAATVRATVDPRASVIEAASARLGSSAFAATRGGSVDADRVRVAIDAAWPDLEALPEVRDPATLDAVGRLVAETAEASADATVTRGLADDLEGAIGRALHQADVLTGVLVGRVGEVVHHTLRTVLTPRFGKGAGDVLVYQAHRAEIGGLVRAMLAERGATLGTDGDPALVIGHSLGGIIAFDLAVTDHRPVTWDALITFGSQSPLLHVLDPRRGLVPPYVPGDPPARSRLPPTIRRWTNLWEPWDPLAFYASNVFELHDGDPVRDVRLPHLTSTPLWTHSIYWTQAESIRAIGEALAAASG